jgi:hypothetical protein
MVGLATNRKGAERSYTLTLPIDLYEQLAALGLAEGRSMHKEMLWLLQEGVAKRRDLLPEALERLAEKREAVAA